ncbi:MAG: hypothetical protein JXR87_06905 [Candidatus Marinimicrobia bacterium]|nr:hypothetical protein [Candidatus Neomarinimicrobiota bacterium]
MVYFTVSIYYLPLVVAVFLCLVVIHYAWQYRHFQIGKSMLVLAIASCWWSFGNVMEYGFNTLRMKQLWSDLEYLGIETVPVAWLIVVMVLTDYFKRLSKRHIFLLILIPVITLFMVFTNPYHGLMRSNMVVDANGPFSIIRKDYGAWFWISAAYNNVVMILATALLFRDLLKRKNKDRRSVILLIFIALLPWIGNTIYILKLIPGMRIDLSASTLSLSGILMTFGITRFQLMGVVPIARRFVIEDLADPILIVDGMNRIMDYNRSCQRLFNLSVNNLAKPLEENLAPLKEFIPQVGEVEFFRREVQLTDNAQVKTYDLRINALYNRRQKLRGRIFHFTDISDHKKAESERERMITELQKALNEVNTLSGFLPICSKCKKIRDDEGYWNEVELFISKRSNIQFSHGLCKDCMKEIYPEEYERLEKKGKLVKSSK